MYNAIFATDELGGIGFQGSLPWPKSTEDFKWFKAKTAGQIVVMGRRTWDDPCFPQPLPNRVNVVLTSKPISIPDVVAVSGDVSAALKDIQLQYPDKQIFFIGGKYVLEQHIGLIDRILLTKHHGSYKVDTALDLSTLLSGFRICEVIVGKQCTFMEYKRNANLPISS